GDGITSRAFKTGENQFIRDVRDDPDYIRGDVDEDVPPTVSELLITVVGEEGVIAVINIESDKPNAFSEQDKNILDILSEHMATNIERIKGLEYERIYEKRLGALHRHAVSLSDADTVEEIASLTVDAIDWVFGYNRISFLLVEEDNLIRVDGIPKKALNELSLEGKGITVRAVKTAQTQLVPDIRKDEDFKSGIKNKDLVPSLSELAVPVIANDRVLAVINVESPSIDDFDETDKRLMELLAESVSSAMARIQRVEDLEEKVEERTAELRQAYEELKELDKMKDQFISMATHELRTPLTSIKGYVDYIQSGSAGEIPDNIEELLDIVQRNTNRLESLTDDLLDQRRIESGKLEIEKEKIDITNLLDEIIEEVKPLIDEKDLRLEVEVPGKTPEIFADKIRIGQVFLNLIENAAKFSQEGTQIKVQIEDENESIKVSVEDEGIGLSDEDKEKLFEPFPDIEKPDFYGGTGLGLSICSGIVEMHGGEIWAE
ncbi:GAF domain-containing protein, partial [Candidatus Bathyarchaeota archaeon]|nr:GAF domain-containing protein [Candidatus Bathyarchaeota archaeon]